MRKIVFLPSQALVEAWEEVERLSPLLSPNMCFHCWRWYGEKNPIAYIHQKNEPANWYRVTCKREHSWFASKDE